MLNDIFNALAEPHRREILLLIHDRELSAGEIAARFKVTRPAISQHLRVLEAARLVAVRREGTKRLYRVRPEGLQELYEFINTFWAVGLLNLKTVIEADIKDKHGDD
jgi:DNA-binding transcriptional ArsR family regulator